MLMDKGSGFVAKLRVKLFVEPWLPKECPRKLLSLRVFS
jgi:hypothetical protein